MSQATLSLSPTFHGLSLVNRRPNCGSLNPLGSLNSLAFRKCHSPKLISKKVREFRCLGSLPNASENVPQEKKLMCKEADQEVLLEESSSFNENALLTTAVMLTPFLLDVEAAGAVEGQLGILEGKSAALIHPIGMISLFAVSCYTGWLGFQWKRTRTLPDEINALKKQIPSDKPEGSPPSEIEKTIAALTEERRTLSKAGYRDQHYNMGSLLLGAGVLFSVSGALNTYFRAGKLFPGPHLFAGAGITVLWAIAAALVPSMQKGNNTARSLHVAANALNILLFAWQLPTGFEIVGKVWQFAPWP